MRILKRTTSDDTDFQNLVRLLDDYLKIIDGDDHAFYAQLNKTDHIKNVVLCYDENYPVGCGAFRILDDNTVEIKRMFVKPEYRGKGIAKLILNELEKWAAELNYKACILETGKQQSDAIGLYQKSGYAIIPNYGQYQYVEASVCMRKEISGE